MISCIRREPCSAGRYIRQINAAVATGITQNSTIRGNDHVIGVQERIRHLDDVVRGKSLDHSGCRVVGCASGGKSTLS